LGDQPNSSRVFDHKTPKWKGNGKDFIPYVSGSQSFEPKHLCMTVNNNQFVEQVSAVRFRKALRPVTPTLRWDQSDGGAANAGSIDGGSRWNGNSAGGLGEASQGGLISSRQIASGTQDDPPAPNQEHKQN
jgi:hypothetical protein